MREGEERRGGNEMTNCVVRFRFLEGGVEVGGVVCGVGGCVRRRKL